MSSKLMLSPCHWGEKACHGVVFLSLCLLSFGCWWAGIVGWWVNDGE